MKETRSKFVVMGALPFRTYTGTVTYTGLRTLGIYDTQEEADARIEECFDEAGGLINVQEVTFD